MVSQDVLSKLNAISEKIIGAAIAVHKEFGPGLLEKVYEICMVQEMEERGLKVAYLIIFNVPLLKQGIMRRLL